MTLIIFKYKSQISRYSIHKPLFSICVVSEYVKESFWFKFVSIVMVPSSH